MSILIKGMEMPKYCYECKMYEADIYYCAAAERDIDIPSSDEGRCSFCPLVPVPPHGRLIDADKAKKHMDCVCDAGGWLEPVTKAVNEYVKKHIDAEPTIIEAEEEQE